MKNMNKKQLLMTTLLSAATIGAASVPASAQSSDDEIIVTGSRISSANVVSSSPVTTLGNDIFEQTGFVDAVSVLNRLPSITAGQNASVSNGATGTSSLNLRGLGANRNLVLIDGKRLGPGTPGISFADVNQVPSPLIERTEVVTGGASAVYGSDAIAGVTNFILKRDFEGLEISGSYGLFVDSNDNELAQAITDASSTDGVTPDQTEVDGFTTDVSITFGTAFDNGKGHLTAFARYVDQNAVLQGDRDISRCAVLSLGSNPGPIAGGNVSCLGSNFGPFPTTFTLGAVNGPNGLPLPADQQPGIVGVVSLDANGNVPRDAAGNVITGSSNAFNFNPTNFFQRPTERFQGGFLANYDLTENVELYLDAAFFRNVTDAQIAPSATFGEIQSVNCNNPFLTPDLVDIVCTQRGFSGAQEAPVQVNRRFVEGGGRNSAIELNNLRFVGGLRGDIPNTNFSYDLFGQYSETSQSTTNTNDGDINLLQEALLVENGPSGLQCTSGRAACLPLNLFGTGPVDPAALAAVLTPTILTGEVTQVVLGGTIQGDVDGFQSPFADSGIALLFGFEYREDKLRSQPDSILIRGGSTGLGGPADPVDASDQVAELFAEVAVPLVSGQPLFQDLSVTGQYRFSDYEFQNGLPGGDQSDGFTSDAYSAGVSWTPVDDIRFRAQYQRAVRAPNVFELFSPVSLSLFGDSDPCSGAVGSANLTATPEQCARTGLPAGLFGLVQEDAGQLQQLGGGNVGLNPESSDTFTIGAVIQPSFVPGLTLSVDYFDISVDDFITNIPSSSILDGCIDNSQPQFCNFINRDALGTLQVDGFISANLQNIAERSSKGFDLKAGYNFSTSDLGFGDFGDISLNYLSTIYTELEQTSFPGASTDDCLGFFGGSCFTGEPNPEYAHNASIGWAKNNLSASFNWRYIGAVESLDITNTDAIGQTFGDENFFDLYGSWDAHEKVSFNVGINNVFDNDPPFTDFRFTGNGNTFPGTYDSAGRYVFVGFNLKL